ncbi:MAG TPA: pyridoxamine 5'-phosphate oxidase family protein [Agriterribacter sp.]|nr:pyridoxamine 5'-phosphate oxidase family protein [Agriterribacter sp.]
MGDMKNLSGDAAVEKLKQIAENATCLFCTHNVEEIVSRPMSTMGIEEDGTLWFFSSRHSAKNIQIGKESKVYLMYADSSKQHYLSLTAHAQVVKDPQKIDELWTPLAKGWFEEGKNDPDLTLLKVRPDEGHYWDTKNGKLVSLLKIAGAALTRINTDAGVEGSMKL